MTRRLLVADDHAVVRHGLKQVLSLGSRVRVTGEAANGAQALELLLAGSFDAALIDMNLPDINGVDLILRMRSHGLALPILVFSMHSEEQVARLALQAGATAYLTKGSSPEAIVAAIEQAIAGPESPPATRGSVTERDSCSWTSVRRKALQSLSMREREIFRLLVAGMRINDIADKLAISNKAVSTYKARLMQKMDFRTSTELVCYGLAHGFPEGGE
jgi:DNA-binding NarL/FixJ family response regulator